MTAKINRGRANCRELETNLREIRFNCPFIGNPHDDLEYIPTIKAFQAPRSVSGKTYSTISDFFGFLR